MTRSTNRTESGATIPGAVGWDPENATPNWRRSKWLVLGELVIVALIFVADARHLIP